MKKKNGKMSKADEKKFFYKANPMRGISLIVLVITIIVVIILAAAVIISLQNNNPMTEANKARIKSDIANMQAIFTNTVGKIMVENQDVIEIDDKQLNSVTTGGKKTQGETTYKIAGEDGNPVVEGKIVFGVGQKKGTTYYTGKELPIYNSETKWYVDKQGMILVEVGGVVFGEGEKSDNPPVEVGEEIAESDNPMLQSWTNNATTDFHAEEYRTKITNIRFIQADRVSTSKIMSWDITDAKDKSVMAWIENDGKDGYILTIAAKEKIVANPNSGFLFNGFRNVKKIENLGLLDTNNVTNMSDMFSNCFELEELDISNFNTNNVINMSSMFYECVSLRELDLSNFDTSKVTSMESMFYRCSGLPNINLSNFNTSNVTNMTSMFEKCEILFELNLFNFDFKSNVVLDSMFSDCRFLRMIEFNNNFNILSISEKYNMFKGCENLSLNLTISETGDYEGYDVFLNAAIFPPAQITFNYTRYNEHRAEQYVEKYSQMFPDSNIVKGEEVELM